MVGNSKESNPLDAENIRRGPPFLTVGKKDSAGKPVNNWTNFRDYGLQARYFYTGLRNSGLLTCISVNHRNLGLFKFRVRRINGDTHVERVDQLPGVRAADKSFHQTLRIRNI